MKNTFNTLLLLSNSITLRCNKSILSETGTLFKTIIRVPLLLSYSATFLYTNIRLLNNELTDFKAESLICENNTIIKKVNIKIDNIVLSSSLSLTISIITLIISLFIFIPESLLNLANILALIFFNI